VALIEIALPPVIQIQRDVFTVRFVSDCMRHECRCSGRVELDACCQYGADVDLFEKERILARTREVQAVLAADVRDPAGWFADDEAELDPEAPSGILTRTGLRDDRCVFLSHDQRGCALHRAAIAAGFEPGEIKPRTCRLFPLELDGGTLAFSEDFADYSCFAPASGPTVYQVMRPTLASVFGDALVRRLDGVERAVCHEQLPRRLRVS
jgi:hypothetical protein